MATTTAIRLIVNADDLGWSQGVNAGIFRGCREGIVTSATLAANMPAAESALAGLAELPDLGVGVHLNACQGPAMSGPGREVLADGDGIMRMTGGGLILRCLLERRRMQQAIAAEFESQVRWCLDRGLRPTHADSHRHVHAWPAIFRLVADLCERYHIRLVRIHGERLPWFSRDRWAACLLSAEVKQWWLSLALNRLGDGCRRIAPDLVATEGTLGVAHTGRIGTEYLLAAIACLRPGTTEIMVHPGYADDLPGEQTRLRHSRQVELQALCDGRLRQALAERKIELVHYGQLRPEGWPGRP